MKVVSYQRDSRTVLSVTNGIYNPIVSVDRNVVWFYGGRMEGMNSPYIIVDDIVPVGAPGSLLTEDIMNMDQTESLIRPNYYGYPPPPPPEGIVIVSPDEEFDNY